MHQLERVYAGDIVIGLVVVAGQSWMAWRLFTRWRLSLSPWLFRALAVILTAIWAVCAFSIYLSFSFDPRFAPRVRAALSAIEILWGFFSAVALVAGLFYRMALRAASPAHLPARRRFLQSAAAAAIAAPAVAAGYGGFIERTRFEVREVELPLAGLHPDLEGFRVAQLSDFHAGAFFSVGQVARAVEMANELKPNLTLVTGDLITQAGDPLDATIAELGRLRSDTGVLGCLGNHEIYADCEDYAAEQARRRGIEFLRSDARMVRWGNGIFNVAGVDFQPFRHKDRYLLTADKLLLPGMPNVLLSHNPDVFPVAVRQGYDGVIGGHTHGGQVTLEILRQELNFARFFTPFVAGLYRLEGRSCYVNAGLGTIGVPVRLGAPPEITLLRLRRA